MTSSASSKTSGGRIPADAPRHHRLAGPGRADHQHVVAAGRRDLERAPAERLPVDVGEVAVAPAAAAPAPAAPASAAADVAEAGRIVQRRDRFGERADGIERAALRRPPPRRVGARQQQRAEPFAPRRRRDRQHAARRLDPAVERQLAEQQHVVDVAPRDAARSRRARRARSAGRTTTPALRMSAGARLTVTRLCGNSKPELRMALRTRSRLSRTDASGRPTIVKPGRPNETSTSTWTAQASIPKTAAVRMQASMRAAVASTGDSGNLREFARNAA